LLVGNRSGYKVGIRSTSGCFPCNQAQEKETQSDG